MIILALDLSTVSTGYAALLDGEFLTAGLIQPKNKPKPKEHVKEKLARFNEIALETKNIIESTCADVVYVEEVNSSPNRIAQKTLSGLHWILMLKLGPLIDKVKFIDSGGATGWRTRLGLRLTNKDKKANKAKKNTITAKHLAQRYANKKFGLELDVDLRKTDSDLADALCIALAAHEIEEQKVV